MVWESGGGGGGRKKDLLKNAKTLLSIEQRTLESRA